MAAAIAAIASVAGGLIGDSMSSSGQAAANQANIEETNKIMGWEQDMSNTAMVRRVQDLKNAGLNPLLAIQQGGASTPTVGQVPMQNTNQAFGQLGNQVSSAAQTGAQVAQAQANVDLASAQARKANADAAWQEGQNPYSGKMAEQEYANLIDREGEMTANIQDMMSDKYLKDALQSKVPFENLNTQAQTQLIELRSQFQQWANQMERLGIPRAEAEARFFSDHRDLGPYIASGAAQLGVNATSALGNVVGSASKLAGFF